MQLTLSIVVPFRDSKKFINKNLMCCNNIAKNLNIDIIDSDTNKVGNTLLNKEILSNEILKKDTRKVFIASALFYDEIYDNIIKLKGNESSIITGLII
tara:strand:- start:2464 stop:2757 length:294 start_codon:yes stop_codon:yes gene_type:complete